MNKQLLDRLKDSSILLAWIAALFLIACLCWVLTKPLRADILRRSVNNAFTQTGTSRQLGEVLAPGTLSPSIERLGYWYSIDNDRRVLVFSLIAEGIFLPCAAIVNSNGRVEELIPLSSSGGKIFNRISPGLKQLYIRRIEGGST